MERKNGSNKNRLILLLRLLYESTDENNPLTANEIVKCFKDQGISVNRRTVMSDIEMLTESGIDIITVRSTQNRYFWGERQFQLPELKLLVDAVASSKFITEKKSTELIKKLTGLTSKGQAAELNRHLYTANRIKPDNEAIYYIVNDLNDAISGCRKVQFKYLEYTADKKKVFRNHGELYEISPFALLWNEDHYYFIGYSDKHEKVVKFRVDRMYKPKITEIEATPIPLDFDIADYSKKIFEMYDGEETTVELQCDNSLMKVVIDRFGEDVDTKSMSDGTFLARLTVSASPTFYGWVFQFAGLMKIVSPKAVKEQYEEMLENARK